MPSAPSSGKLEDLADVRKQPKEFMDETEHPPTSPQRMMSQDSYTAQSVLRDCIMSWTMLNIPQDTPQLETILMKS